jgi:hypothetical protein
MNGQWGKCCQFRGNSYILSLVTRSFQSRGGAVSPRKKLFLTILVVALSAIVGVTGTKAALRYFDDDPSTTTVDAIPPQISVRVDYVTDVNLGSDGTTVGMAFNRRGRASATAYPQSVGLMTAEEAIAYNAALKEQQAIRAQEWLRVQLNTPTPTKLYFDTAQPKSQEALLKNIMAAFQANEPRPPRRLAHFQWLVNHPVLHVSGWHGYVKELTPLGGGAWRVQIGMSPTVVSKIGGVAFIKDHVRETWLYQNGQLEYAPSPVPDHPPVPNSYFID